MPVNIDRKRHESDLEPLSCVMTAVSLLSDGSQRAMNWTQITGEFGIVTRSGLNADSGGSGSWYVDAKVMVDVHYMFIEGDGNIGVWVNEAGFTFGIDGQMTRQ